MAILELQGIHKTFRQGFLGRKTRVLRGVDLAVEPGEVFGLLGHNGAGKSTTLKIVLGLLRADAGRVRLFGRDGIDRDARSRLGYLSEEIGLYPHLNAVEMLRLVGELFRLPRRRIDARIDELLEAVGLADKRRVRIRHYSKGMRQRLGVAAALFNDPDLLLLDEPYSGLDPVGRRDLRNLLQRLKAQGKTIVMSSHIVPDVEAVCDRVGILRGGRIVRVLDLGEVYADRTNDVEVVISGLEAGRLDPRDYGGTIAHRDERVTIVRCSGDRRLRALVDDVYDAGARVVGVRQVRLDLEEVFVREIDAARDEAARADRVDTERLVTAREP